MKTHSEKFDEHVLKLRQNEANGLPRDAGLTPSSSKVRNGKVDTGKHELSPHHLAALDKKWRDVVEKETGYGDYDSFRKGINMELGRKFA